MTWCAKKREDRRFFFTHARVEIAKDNLHTLRVANIAVLILMLLFFVLSEVLLTNWEISPYHTALFPVLRYLQAFRYGMKPESSGQVISRHRW